MPKRRVRKLLGFGVLSIDWRHKHCTHKNLGCFTKLRPRFVQARLRWDGSRAKEGGVSLAHAPLGPSVTASTAGRRFGRCLDEGCLGAKTAVIGGGATAWMKLSRSFGRLRLTAVRVSRPRPPLRAPSAPWCRGCPFGRHLCDRSMDRSCMQKEPKLLFQDSKSRKFCGRSGLPNPQKPHTWHSAALRCA